MRGSIVCALVACGSSRPVAPPGQPEPRDAAVAIAPDATAPPPVTPAVPIAVPIPVLGEIGVVEQGPKMYRFTYGSLRGGITPDGVGFAADRFAFPIVASARTQSGWVFAAADGVVARAETFLGPLVTVGAVPRGLVPAMPASCGRLAVAVGEQLFTSDGGALVLAATPPGIVVGAAFADGQHGMVVLAGGALFETRDAGATFTRVELGPDAAASVRCEAGKLRVDTSSASIVFGNGTRNTKTAAPESDLPPDLRQAVRRTALRVYPELAEQLGGLRMDDGTPMFLHGDHASSDLPDEPKPYAPSSKCKLLRWGPDAALACEKSLVRVDARGTHRKIASDVAGSLILSDDGLHAIWDCTPATPRPVKPTKPPTPPPPPVPSTHCIYSHRAVRKVPGNAPHGLLRGNLLVAGHPLSFRDIDSGAVVRIADPIPQPTPIRWSDTLVLAGDGSIATANASGTDATAPAWVSRTNLADGAGALLRLPDGATRSGFIDAQRGIAAGADLTNLWRTEDGGAHWIPFVAQVEGTILARPNRYDPKWLADWAVTCTRTRCTVDGRVTITFDPVAPGAHVIASPLAIAPTGAGILRPDPIAWRGLTCEPKRARATPLLDARTARVYYEAAVRAKLTVRGKQIAMTWSGFDRFGAYRATAAGTMPSEATIEEWGGAPTIRASRAGVLVEGDVWMWLPANGRAVPIADPNARRGVLVDSLALPDGTVLLVQVFVTPEYMISRSRSREVRFSWASIVDRAGKLLTRHAYYWPFDGHSDVRAAMHAGVPGVALVDTDRVRPPQFVPIRGTAGATLTRFDTLPICAGAQADTRTLTVIPTDEQVTRSSNPLVRRRAYVREGPRPCVESYDLVSPYSSDSASSVSASGGGLVGERYGYDEVETVRCKPGP